MLPLAEFVYNNAKNTSTGASPFYANYKYHSRATLKILPDKRHENPMAEAYIDHVQQMHQKLRMTLEQAQMKYKKEFDRNAVPAPEFKVGDYVQLNQRNIETTRLSQKLDQKPLGPFKIVDVVSESKAAFKLKLLLHWRMHPVFHASLLDPYQANKIGGREQPLPKAPEIINGELEYEVDAVLDSRTWRNKLQYLVEWKGYGPEERTWKPAENLENAKEAVAAFHLHHSNQPSTMDLKDSKPRRSLAHRRERTVINDSSDSPERADSPEPMPTQRDARSMSGADADPGGIRWAQRETSPTSWNSVSSPSPKPHEPGRYVPVRCR